MLSVSITIVGKCRLPGQPRQKAGAGATCLAERGAARYQEPCALFPAAAGGSSFEKAKIPQSSASASTEASSRAADQKARGALPVSPFERKGLPMHRSEPARRISPPSRDGGSRARDGDEIRRAGSDRCIGSPFRSNG